MYAQMRLIIRKKYEAVLGNDLFADHYVILLFL